MNTCQAESLTLFVPEVYIMSSLLSPIGMGSVYGDLSYYDEIRWLACHKVLKVFCDICEIVLLWK